MSQNVPFSPPEVYTGFSSESTKPPSEEPTCQTQPSTEILKYKLYHHGFIIPSPPPSPKEVVETVSGVNLAEAETQKETQEEVQTIMNTPSTTFVARVFDLYRRNPRAMLRNERRWLSYHTAHGGMPETARKRATRSQATVIRRVASTPRVAVVRPATKPKTHVFSLGMPNYKPKQSSREHYMHTHSFDVANTPYELLPDFCPPTSTLDKINHPRPLRAEWKGIPLDLSNDPHVDQLHPAEVYLASQLRLPAMVYLDNKRRIFAEYHARKEAGLGFRRTDAQRCARIDVNKASRLWQAFERVGWLD